jgi:hypothetical protein
MSERVKRPYTILCTREGTSAQEQWVYTFGDYDKAVVRQERMDWYDSNRHWSEFIYHPTGVKNRYRARLRDCCVLYLSDDTKEAIESAVHDLNVSEFEGQNRP